QPERGRFRGYLKTVTNNLMAELKRARRKLPMIAGADILDRIEVRTDLIERLEAEHRQGLRKKAGKTVRGRGAPRTWLAFEETAMRARKPAEVARELGMTVGAVYQAKYCVLNELRREIAILEGLT